MSNDAFFSSLGAGAFVSANFRFGDVSNSRSHSDVRILLWRCAICGGGLGMTQEMALRRVCPRWAVWRCPRRSPLPQLLQYGGRTNPTFHADSLENSMKEWTRRRPRRCARCILGKCDAVLLFPCVEGRALLPLLWNFRTWRRRGLPDALVRRASGDPSKR